VQERQAMVTCSPVVFTPRFDFTTFNRLKPKDKRIRRQQAEIARDVLKERDRRFLMHYSAGASTEQINKIKSFLDQENKAIEQDMDSTEDSWLGQLKI